MNKKTIKLPLFNRSEEIYNELPKEYRDIIFNNLITKSILNKNFIDELSLYLNNDEIDEILEKLEIFLKQTKKRKENYKTYVKKTNSSTAENKENIDVFTF